VSVRVISAVFEHSEATGTARLVLLAIADASDHHGAGCWRGKETIARMARTSRATVTRSITELEALGELVVDRRAGRTSTYQILLPGIATDGGYPQPPANPAQNEPTNPAQNEPTPPEVGSNRAYGRPTGAPTPGSPVSRDPCTYPSIDPRAETADPAPPHTQPVDNHQGPTDAGRALIADARARAREADALSPLRRSRGGDPK
jgi:hypothetical protein